jgi:hypothetical protein
MDTRVKPAYDHVLSIPIRPTISGFRCRAPPPACFAGTSPQLGLVLFESYSPFPEKRREIPIHGKVETGFS